MGLQVFFYHSHDTSWANVWEPQHENTKLAKLFRDAHFWCTAWHFLSRIKKKNSFLPLSSPGSEVQHVPVRDWKKDWCPETFRDACVSSFALVRQCPVPTPPSLYSSTTLAQQGQGSTLPNPAPERPNDQKSHLEGGPTKAQGFLWLSMSAACLDPTFLSEFVSEHCWNPGIGSYVCFSVPSLSFTPYSNSLFLEDFE